MSMVYAELTDDSRSVVLIGSGHTPTEQQRFDHRLKLLTPLVKDTKPPGGIVVAATWPAMTQLNSVFGSTLHKGPKLQAWLEQELSRRTADVTKPLTYQIPDGLTPYPWQVAGANLIAATGKCLINDEPRVGKTVTTILGLIEAHQYPALIVCPASVVHQWVKEFQTWAPHLRTAAWMGAPKKRHALSDTADVYVTSYDTCVRDTSTKAPSQPLLDLNAKSVVADEHHVLKSSKSRRYWAVRRLSAKAEVFVALSGTPITHHPGDLWTTLSCLDLTSWPSKERYTQRYLLTVHDDYREIVLGFNPVFEQEFRLSLLGQQRRVAKADVVDQLPSKIYTERVVELPPKWRKVYNDLEKDMFAELPDSGDEVSVMETLTKLTHLFQLSAAPVEFESWTEMDEKTGEEKTRTRGTLLEPSWKVDALMEVLEEQPGSPVVAFAQSKQLVRLAGQRAASEGCQVGYIIGGQNSTDRAATIEQFQDGKLDLICVTTQAGGVGITLSRSNTVVFLQRPWSLVDALQAEERIVSLSKKDSLDVVDIIAAHTIDARVRAVLRDKGQQLADLVQDKRIVEELLGGKGKK